MLSADIFIWASVVALAGVLAVAWGGRWRRFFALFGIRERQMTIEKLGFAVRTPMHRERVTGVFRSFSAGFNTMIAGRSFSDWQRYCDEQTTFYQPFAHEGAAMGYPLRALGSYSPKRFEAEVVKAYPQYRYLYYVGLGFWSGMRRHGAKRLEAMTGELDPLYRMLCFDGYGFKHGFFDYGKGPDALVPLMNLEGYARHAAYQGLGRSLYFRFMDEPEQLIAHLRGLGEYAADAASGVGLASVFLQPDRLDIARELAMLMDPAWRPAMHQGMCFGLKARYLNHVEQFERDIDKMDHSIQEAVFASIRECDRIELQVRADCGADAYRIWRERLAAWMTERVEYPLTSLKAPAKQMAS